MLPLAFRINFGLLVSKGTKAGAAERMKTSEKVRNPSPQLNTAGVRDESEVEGAGELWFAGRKMICVTWEAVISSVCVSTTRVRLLPDNSTTSPRHGGDTSIAVLGRLY